MARKSFKGGAAAMFISTDYGQQTDNTDNAINTDNTDSTDSTDNAHNTGAKQKTRSDEIKNYRYNLLLRPSIVADARKIAYIRQTSVNDLINRVLADYIAQPVSIADIEKYNATFDEKER